ncbi:PEP-CTERM sorting domain-containing protein [Myxococcota bacterium]|nr:PEP-CTERM sorting domain-containing protein [Myxococcota bacterium]
MAVTNDGTVYGNGLRDRTSNGIPLWQAVSALRWNAAGESERLAGTDSEGRAWKLSELVEIGSNGASWLGFGDVEKLAVSGVGVESVNVIGVFDESGLDFPIIDARRDAGTSKPFQLGMSADASIIYGHRQIVTPDFSIVNEPRIWTRGGGEVSFRVFLESMGLDTTGWNIGEILDMSDDGRSFLVNGSEIGHLGRQLVIVVPEPGGAWLLGLGLIGLARQARTSRRSHPAPIQTSGFESDAANG